MPRGAVDWNTIEATLVEIHKLAPDFLEENVLIGGGASFFYKRLVEKAADKDFPPILETGETRFLWMSKDIDFIGTPKDEIPSELGIEEGGSGKCTVNGVWIDSPDVGYTFNSAIAKSTAIAARSESHGVDFLVISPALLLKEKRALIKDTQKNRPQDEVHAKTLGQAIKVLLCQWVEAKPSDKERIRAWKTLADEVKEYVPDLLDDRILSRRLISAAEHLKQDPIAKSAYHWIKHKVPAEGASAP